MIKAYKYNDDKSVFLFDDEKITDDLVSTSLLNDQVFTISKDFPYGVYLTNDQYENLVMKLLTEFAEMSKANQVPQESLTTDHTDEPKGSKGTESNEGSCKCDGSCSNNDHHCTCKMGHSSEPVKVKVMEMSHDELLDLVLYGMRRFF